MLKPILITSLLALTSVFAASAGNKYELNIGDFTQLKVSSPINVVYVCNPDSAGIAVFEASPEIASEIAFTNNKKKLNIGFTTSGTKLTGVPTITVYSRFLTMVENHADSLVRLTKVASGPELKLRLMGSGRISATNVETNNLSATLLSGKGSIAVTGNCINANLTNHSLGVIQTDGLRAENVKVWMMGTGDIGCWPIEKLTIQLVSAGTGKVLYRGTPKTISNRSINIKVEQIKE